MLYAYREYASSLTMEGSFYFWQIYGAYDNSQCFSHMSACDVFIICFIVHKLIFCVSAIGSLI